MMMVTNDTNLKNNGILIVTSQPSVRDWLYDAIKKRFSKEYVIVGDAPTRESAIEMAIERKPEIIIFIERTAGVKSLSSTIYNLRLSGARVIYISTERFVGDLVLEAIIGYGVYDIILNPSLDIDELEFLIRNPKDFRDVSIFHREVVVPDEGHADRNYKIPDLKYLISLSHRLSEDYLIDPMEKAVEGTRSVINRSEEDQNLTSAMFRDQIEKAKQVSTINNNKNQSKPTNQKPNIFEHSLGDLDDLNIDI